MKKELTYQEALDKLVNIADALDKKQDELSPEMSDIVSALSLKHKDDVVDDNWDNVWDMMEDIREYAKNNDRSVINEDRPHQLRLAWRCAKTNKTWSIRIADFKKSLSLRSLEVQDILRTSIMTQEGKKNLTSTLNSKE